MNIKFPILTTECESRDFRCRFLVFIRWESKSKMNAFLLMRLKMGSSGFCVGHLVSNCLSDFVSQIV
jgi:hypothetical protein